MNERSNAPTPREGNGNSGNFADGKQKERAEKNEAEAGTGEPAEKSPPPA
jgi:hypothetical protein